MAIYDTIFWYKINIHEEEKHIPLWWYSGGTGEVSSQEIFETDKIIPILSTDKSIL